MVRSPRDLSSASSVRLESGEPAREIWRQVSRQGSFSSRCRLWPPRATVAPIGWPVASGKLAEWESSPCTRLVYLSHRWLFLASTRTALKLEASAESKPRVWPALLKSSTESALVRLQARG